MTSTLRRTERLKPLSITQTQSYLTDDLQVFDLVEWCASQMPGRVQLYQTSFSISEEYLRRLFFWRKKGRVAGVTLVLDHKALTKSVHLWPFITRTIEKVYLTSNHSKIILIQSDVDNSVDNSVTRVAIVTSQNLTRGNRQESAIITTEPEVFNNLMSDLTQLLRYQSVPMHEVIKSKING